MDVSLLRRRDTQTSTEPSLQHPALRPASDVRALESLDRWIDDGDGVSADYEPSRGIDAALLGSPAERLGKGALRMAASAAKKEADDIARKEAGKIARAAAAKLGHLFAQNGERQALSAFSRVPQRTLANLAKSLPAKVEAHVLEHTRAIAGKPSHSQFAAGMSIDAIKDLALKAVRSGARPILSVSDNGALAFVFEHEFPEAIGKGGEKILRVVVDAEGRLVTTFPVAATKKLASVTIRGLPVAASVAGAVFVSALAETEAEAATADAVHRVAKANESSWFEKALELLGPYGIFESSPIAIEPNFAAIAARTKAALAEARQALGRELTTEEKTVVERCVYSVWADAAAEANGG